MNWIFIWILIILLYQSHTITFYYYHWSFYILKFISFLQIISNTFVLACFLYILYIYYFLFQRAGPIPPAQGGGILLSFLLIFFYRASPRDSARIILSCEPQFFDKVPMIVVYRASVARYIDHYQLPWSFDTS